MRGAWLAFAIALVPITPEGVARAKPPPPPAPPAPAGPKSLADTLTGDAKADYDGGKLLYADGDYASAAIKFQSAFDKSDDPRLLWNIAACHKNERHYARAVVYIKRYVATGGALLTDQDRADAKGLLDAIEPFTIQLTIKVSEPGADVLVDDVNVGTSPLAKAETVDIGMRKVVVKKAGFKEYSSTQALGGSKEATVEVKLETEVHEGELKVTSAPDAHVFLDGKEVGIGSFKGKVPSGGHTLRVTAAGMQTYQSEVVVTDDEKRSIDVPLAPEVDLSKLAVPQKKVPTYLGFYGRLSTPFLFGFGTGYVAPPGAQGTPTPSDGVGGPYLSLANLKLMMGYTFGWLGIEGVAMYMFGARFNGGFNDPSGTQVVKSSYPMMSGFFGVGARATSKHPIIRFTGGVALGAGPHQFVNGGEKLVTYAPCDNNNNNSMSCQGNSASLPSPGYTSFAMAGDVGILLGNGSPGGKFWVGVDWYVDFPPDIAVQVVDPRIPAQYVTNGGATILHGPQFFIGPVLGVGFGH